MSSISAQQWSPNICIFRPGDHVVWKDENAKHSAIVQSVNAAERTAIVLLTETGEIKLVSMLEIDPHGAIDMSEVIPQSASEGFGVRRGDFVFVHREGTTNGFEKPFVPKIGELETWVREDPVVEGRLSGWKKAMADIGASIAARCASEGAQDIQISHPIPGSSSLLWLGEVTDVCRLHPRFVLPLSFLFFIS